MVQFTARNLLLLRCQQALKESYLQLTRSVSGKRVLSEMILMLKLEEFKKKPVIFAVLTSGTGGNLPSQLFSTK